MFELAVPWWELVLRGSVVYFVLMLLLRWSGKRTVGQFTPFDLLVLVLLGDAVQGSMLSGDESLQGGLILAATLLGWNWLTGFATARSSRVEQLVESAPAVLVHNGKVYEQALHQSNLTLDDLKEAMRKADCVLFSEVRLAMLERDGHISVVTRKD
ncbi:MAG TPA: YetF domain-containing protein [Luteimonas sp.]